MSHAGSFASAASGSVLSTESEPSRWRTCCDSSQAQLHARCWLPFAGLCPETASVLALLPQRLGALATRDFFRLHLLFFLVSTLVGAASVARLDSLPYIDAWVLTSGAMTGASLVPFDVARLSRGSEVVAWFLMTGGGVTLTGLWAMGYRVWSFRSRLAKSLRRCAKLSKDLRRASKARLPRAAGDGHAHHAHERPLTGVGSVASARAVLEALDAEDTLLSELTLQDEGLVAVAAVTAAYTLFWHIVTPCALYSSILRRRGSGSDALLWAEMDARRIQPGWLCLYLSTSAFNNVGLSMLSNSALELANNAPALLTLCAAILAGNAAFPLALRFLLRCGAALGARYPSIVRPAWRRGCRYALRHPQRVYHLLFPARETYALLTALLATNLQLAVVLGSSATSIALRPPGSGSGHAAYSAFFAVVNTRSAGFTTLDLNSLAPVCLVVFGFAMWWSPYPLVAVWTHARAPTGTLTQFIPADPHAERPGGVAPPRRPLVGRHLLTFPVLTEFSKMYLLRHAVWLWLAFVAIAAAEGRLMQPGPAGEAPPTSLFAFLFEILSAYGCNGYSLGWPGEVFTYSLCGRFTTFSKLVIIAVMFLGRHRSMPRQIDPPLAARVARAEALVAAARAELAALPGAAHSSSFFSFLNLSSFGGAEGGALRSAMAFIRGERGGRRAERGALAVGGEGEEIGSPGSRRDDAADGVLVTIPGEEEEEPERPVGAALELASDIDKGGIF